MPRRRSLSGACNTLMIDDQHPLLLGSGSPRRSEILRGLGIPLRTRPVGVDETPARAELPGRYLERVVASKLEALAATAVLPAAGALLVADTIVVCDGQILGKPRDEEQAHAMLSLLSARSHTVSTRFALASPEHPSRCLHAEDVHTEVWFRKLTGEHIARYVATGEVWDKAGSYAIQAIGGFAVARIAGSYSNVVGLPACEVVAALEAAGLLGGFPRAGAGPR
jgi:septum formation protein